MAKLFKDLALALLNATLLLVAICLFLAWRLTATVDGMVGTFASNLQVVAPLRQDVQAMTAELAALRADLAALKSQTGEINSAALQTLQARVDKMEARVAQAGDRIDALKRAPRELVDQAIETSMQSAASAFSTAINDIRTCEPPEG